MSDWQGGGGAPRGGGDPAHGSGKPPQKGSGPPRLAVWLLRRLLRGVEHASLLGDLDEAYERLRATRGRGAAGRRYWRETLSALARYGGRSRRGGEWSSRGESGLRSFLSDLRYAGRFLRRDGTFAVISVLTLGLAMGATAAIFSVVNPVLLRPLPYPDPGRIVLVWEREKSGASSNTGFATFRDVQRESRTLERAAAVGSWQPTIRGADESERVVGQRVSWTYFSVLGVHPELGRDFTAAEDVPGQHVVILSHGLWERRFGGDASLVGRTIDIDGTAHLVAGVMPADFENVMEPRAQIWRVLAYSTEQPWACRTCRHLRLLARVRPGTSLQVVDAELDRISATLVAAHPKEYPAAGMNVEPLAAAVAAPVKPVLLAVLGAVGLVLLIAMVNVAHLQLARGLRRGEEFAIRAALGAGRGRLARQLLAEGTLVALAGATMGLVIALVTVPLLRARLPASLPRLGAIHLDGWTLLIMGAITLSIALLVGLGPALASGISLSASAPGGGTRLTSRRHPARAVLVISEIALALLLLVGAGLLSRSLLRVLEVNGGFDPSRVLTLEIQATGAGYPDDASVRNHFAQVLERVQSIPGVVAAGVSNQIPLDGNFDRYGIRAQDRPLANPELAPSADRYTVSPGFLRAMGITLLRGRPLEAADDRPSAYPVVLVSAALAERIWSGEDPIGKHVRLGGPDTPWREVVGMTADVHQHGLDNPLLSQIFIPLRQWTFADDVVTLVVRTSGDPQALATRIREAVHDLDPSQPIMHLQTMDRLVAASTARRRVALLLFAAFASLAALLAGAGIYGVLAGSVSERTREIGVRAALGASPGRILGLVLRDSARLTVAGMLLGLAGALALSRFLQSLLFQVGAADPVTLAGVALLMALVALIAGAAPALRALRIDPRRALDAQ